MTDFMDMLKGGTPVSKLKAYVENYNQTGQVSQKEYDQAKNTISSLKVGTNYFENK